MPTHKLSAHYSRSLIGLCFVFLSLQALCGQETDAPPIEDSHLSATILVSDSPKYIKDWVTTPQSKTIHIKRVRVFLRGEPIYAAFVASGYVSDAHHRCKVHADYELTNPASKIVFSEKNYAALSGPAQTKSVFTMLDPALDLGFDGNDPFGTYLLKLTVIDEINRQKATAEEKIILVDSKETKRHLSQKIAEPSDLDQLWKLYFSEQQPYAVERIISVLYFADGSTLKEKLLGSAAKWSLTQNASEHRDIRAICEQYASTNNNENAKTIRQLLNGMHDKQDRTKQ